MMELQDVCEKLDETLLNFFEVLGQIYQEQAKLEQYMKDGYLNLSRARYTMGVKSVGALQLPDKDMTPLLTVDICSEKKETKFEFRKDSVKSQKKSEDEVRKRNVNKDSGDTTNIETIGQSDDVKVDKDLDKNNVPSRVDPIKWFGVLVPQALRTSQSRFQEAAGLAVTVANLKQRLEIVRKDYTMLLTKKRELVSKQPEDH